MWNWLREEGLTNALNKPSHTGGVRRRWRWSWYKFLPKIWPQNLHMIHRYLLSTYEEPATVLGTKDITVKEMGKDSALSLRAVTLIS